MVEEALRGVLRLRTLAPLSTTTRKVFLRQVQPTREAFWCYNAGPRWPFLPFRPPLGPYSDLIAHG